MPRSPIHVFVRLILPALAALLTLGAPASAAVWRIDITGTFDPPNAAPFAFTVVYDTARAPSPVLVGPSVFDYSSSGILWTSLTFGSHTFNVSHMTIPEIAFDVDLDQARPTKMYIGLADGPRYLLVDFPYVEYREFFEYYTVRHYQLTATKLVPAALASWNFENPPFVAGALNGQQGWSGNGGVESAGIGPFNGAQDLHLDASVQYVSANHALNIPGAGQTLTVVADFLRIGGSAAGGISVNSDTGFLAQLSGGPSYKVGGATSSTSSRDFADREWHRLALTIDFAAGKLGGAVDGIDLGTIPWTNPTPPTRLTSISLSSFDALPLDVYFDNVAVLVPQPRNDDCAAAATVGLGTTSFNSRGATTDGPATSTCGFCCGDPQINQDIWYSFVSPGTGLTTVTTCGSSINTKLAVYGGMCGSLGPTLACNDDSASCVGGGVAQGSRLTFLAASGQAYLIRVGGYPNTNGSGPGVVNISQVATVPCWTQVQTPTSPPARREASMTFDPVRGRTVLACGIANDLLDDTWTFNGLNWSPAGLIPSRGAAPMSFHAGLGKSVLYSGYGTNAQTMEFDGSAWADVSGAVGSPTPPVFFWHSTAYDAPRGRLVLFGGTDYGGFLSDQTWTFNGSTWSRQMIPGPGRRTRSGLVADTTRNVLVLFAGSDLSNTAYNDTWEYDGSAWTQQSLVFPAAPARYGHAMFYDPVRQRTIVIGGKATDGSVLNDAWEYDGTTWSALGALGAGPVNRYYQSVAYDSTRKFAVLFGGFNAADVPQADTWLLSVGPAIAAAPVGGPLCRTNDRILSVQVYDPAATFQWRRNGVDIPGATSSSLAVHPGAAGAGLYDCSVFTACGAATSAAAALTWCAPDFNCSGTISVQDIFDYLATYFSDTLAADFNNSGGVSVQDIFDFLAAYFAGCA